jgi:hypothetical protein
VLPALVLGATLGCAGTGGYYPKLDALLAEGAFGTAATFTESNRSQVFGSNSDFLYHLEMGMLHQLAGNYQESNRLFEHAKLLGQRLFTKSLSRGAASFLVNDRVLPYHGENFERALIHVFSALNYAMLGNDDGAAVEARQADFVLSKLQTDYGQKNVYKEDAFARFLSAMLFENRGDWGDAVVAYRQALSAYRGYAKVYGTRRPSSLLPAAMAAALMRGGGATERLRDRWGQEKPRSLPEGFGEVVVLHYNGWIPQKAETFFEISFGRGWAYVGDMQARSEDQAETDTAFAAARSIAASEIIRIAFPTFVERPYQVRRLQVGRAGSSDYREAELVEDLGAIAVKDLKDRIGRIRARAIARAAFKYAASKGACHAAEKEMSPLAAGFTCAGLEATRIATERADVRSWRTLPDKILMAVTPLPAGAHSLSLRFTGAGGNLITERVVDGIEVQAGRKTFLAVRTVH